MERGFGLTLGNAIRRVLLSSLEGAAITNVRITDVMHEIQHNSGREGRRHPNYAANQTNPHEVAWRG